MPKTYVVFCVSSSLVSTDFVWEVSCGSAACISMINLEKRQRRCLKAAFFSISDQSFYIFASSRTASCRVANSDTRCNILVMIVLRRSGLVFELTQLAALAVFQYGKSSLVVPNSLARSKAVSARFLVNFIRVHAHGRIGLDD